MSSCLTSGITVNCEDQSPGGLQGVWIAEEDSVDQITFDVDGNVDAIVMNGANVFYSIGFGDFQGQFTEDFPLSDTGVVVGTQTMNLTIPGRSSDLRKTIQEALDCRCGFYVIHQEFTGDNVWIWGYLNKRRAKASNAADSGTVLTDQNQEVLTLTAQTTEKAVIFTLGVPGIPV